ncbi:MAG: hypothetical protein HFI67_12135 [Lachnospiraceae bacterium]|jgi:hypothetical protein|nr:hypothetical protein [Lachnospiraceae bacterium]
MPRGRKKKSEETDLPIIETNNEIGSIPFFVLEQNKYGVYTDKISYSLVRRKKSSKTVKNEEGIDDHLETYYTWEPFKWTRTFKDIIETYIEHREKELDSTLTKEYSFDKIKNNRDKILSMLQKSFSVTGSNKEVFEFSELLEHKDRILRDLDEIKENKNKIENIINEIEDMLKSKKKLIDVSKIVSKKENKGE